MESNMNVSDLLLLVFLFHSHSIKFSMTSTKGFSPVNYFSFVHLAGFAYIHMYTCLLQRLTIDNLRNTG